MLRLNTGFLLICRLLGQVRAWKPKLVDQGYQELVFEDAQDMLTDQLATIASSSDPMSLDILECNFRDDTVSNMVRSMCRRI